MSFDRLRSLRAVALGAFLWTSVAPAETEPFEKDFKREWETKQWGLRPYPGEENDRVFLAPEKDENGASTQWKKIEIRKLDGGKIVAGAEAPAEILLMRPGGPGRALVLTGRDAEGKAQHLLEVDAKGKTVWSLKVDAEVSGLYALSCADCAPGGMTLVAAKRKARNDCGEGEREVGVVAELGGDGRLLREFVWNGPDQRPGRNGVQSVRAAGEKAVLLTDTGGVYMVDWTGKILRTIHSQKRCPHAPDSKQDIGYLDALPSGEGRHLISYSYARVEAGRGRERWMGRVAEIDVEGKEIWSAGCGYPRWLQLLPTDAILVWQGEISKMPPMKIQGSTEGAVAMEFHRRGNGGIRERVNGRNGISRWYSKEHGPFQAKGPVCRVRVQASPDSRLDDEQIKELYKQGLMK